MDLFWPLHVPQGRVAPIVETHVLNDPEELDRKLQLLQEGLNPPQIAVQPPVDGVMPPTLTIDREMEPGLPADTVLPVILQQTPSMFADEPPQAAFSGAHADLGPATADVVPEGRHGADTVDLLQNKASLVSVLTL